MEKDNNNKKKQNKKPEISDDDGLNVSYAREEMEQFFPHLTAEMSNRDQSMRIDSVSMEVEEDKPVKKTIQKTPIPDELRNPGAIDFIRRCKTNEEAMEILDFLLKREELTLEKYKELSNRISQDGGLGKLINESGGPKERGYYLNKYYFGQKTNQNSIKKEDE